MMSTRCGRWNPSPRELPCYIACFYPCCLLPTTRLPPGAARTRFDGTGEAGPMETMDVSILSMRAIITRRLDSQKVAQLLAVFFHSVLMLGSVHST
jgi:hypothetical protein